MNELGGWQAASLVRRRLAMLLDSFQESPESVHRAVLAAARLAADVIRRRARWRQRAARIRNFVTSLLRR